MGICGSSDVQQQPTNSSGGGAGRRQPGNAAMLARCVQDWDKDYPAITRAQLMAQRNEFWDTRVEGRPEMWQALRASAEVGDEATARVLMDSAGLTPYDCDAPYSLFCYDSRGARYDVPMYCLHEPRSLIPSERVPAGAPATGVPPLPAASQTVTTTVVTASGITISSTAPTAVATAGAGAGAVTDPVPIVAAQPINAGGGGGGGGGGATSAVLMPGQLSTTPGAAASSGGGDSKTAPAAIATAPAPVPAPAHAAAAATAAPAPATATSDIEFKVRLSTGEADIPMSLPASASIGDLKSRIAGLRPIPIDKQRVIFSGALLKDSVTIAVAKIKPKAIVQIMVTL